MIQTRWEEDGVGKAGLCTTSIKTELLSLSIIKHRLPNPKLSRYFRPLIVYQTAPHAALQRLLHVFRIREVQRQNLVPESEHTTRVSLDTKVNTDNRIKAFNSTVYAIRPQNSPCQSTPHNLRTWKFVNLIHECTLTEADYIHLYFSAFILND